MSHEYLNLSHLKSADLFRGIKVSSQIYFHLEQGHMIVLHLNS